MESRGFTGSPKAATRHTVIPVVEIGDASEAFCFTLSTEGAAGIVQAFQAGIRIGLYIHFDLQIKLAGGEILNDQMLVSHLVLVRR